VGHTLDRSSRPVHRWPRRFIEPAVAR